MVANSVESLVDRLVGLLAVVLGNRKVERMAAMKVLQQVANLVGSKDDLKVALKVDDLVVSLVLKLVA